MTIKEFLNLIDIERINENDMQIIIPIQEKFPIDENKVKNDFIINEKRKIIIEGCGAIPEDYDPFVERFFKICRKSNKKNDECYDLIDLKELKDGTYYVHDGRKNVWLIINF